MFAYRLVSSNIFLVLCYYGDFALLYNLLIADFALLHKMQNLQLSIKGGLHSKPALYSFNVFIQVVFNMHLKKTKTKKYNGGRITPCNRLIYF